MLIVTCRKRKQRVRQGTLPSVRSVLVHRESNAHHRVSTLKIVEEEERLSPAQLAEVQEKRKALPQVSFPTLMRKLAQEIVETSEGGPIDVVFVIDASGSMGDNIKSVIEHLSEMVDVYKKAKIDYALGVTEFWARNKQNFIKVVQLTKSFTDIQTHPPSNLYPSGRKRLGCCRADCQRTPIPRDI